MKYNFDNGQKTFWAYEIGRTYKKVSEADEKFSGVKETQVLEGVLTGEVQEVIVDFVVDLDKSKAL